MKFHAGEASARHMGKKRLYRAVILIFIALLAFAAFDSRMVVRRYVIDAEKTSSEIRIAFVADLHSCRYGKGQDKLIEAVNKLAPDLVLLGGDIFDDDLPDTNTELFLAGIAGRYPCYYVTGNHEYWSGPAAFADKMAILQKYGITILSGSCETISIGDETINICGVDDPAAYAEAGRQDAFIAQLEQVAAACEDGSYTVLLSHRPESFEVYADLGFDLALCGHAHGGQWRLPLILNGLFAPDQGLFPSYAGGQYAQDGTTMIVSRGLARESTRVPRIFNRPELLLVEIE